jgi:hypothetical protein
METMKAVVIAAASIGILVVGIWAGLRVLIALKHNDDSKYRSAVSEASAETFQRAKNLNKRIIAEAVPLLRKDSMISFAMADAAAERIRSSYTVEEVDLAQVIAKYESGRNGRGPVAFFVSTLIIGGGFAILGRMADT